MINAKDIIKYDRTEEELQELILFLIAVAGKNADTTARMLDKLLSIYPSAKLSPFDRVKAITTGRVPGRAAIYIPTWDTFEELLKRCGFGCQTRLARAFTEVANSGLNLKTCSLDDLMSIHGIGRKSASCFLAWTRPKVKVAMLDVHLMKYIRNEMGHADAPKATPSSKKQYDYYEKLYLDHCKKLKKDPTSYDLEIWKKYAYGGKV